MKNLSRMAVIDLGTNSVRFEVVQVYSDFSYRKLYTSKHMVRLGDGVFSTGQLQNEAMERALVAFQGFQKKMKSLKVDHCVAYATSAMRSVSNGEDFIKKVYAKTKIKIQIIDGKIEADLIGKAIVKNENFLKALYVIIDIGGGSTELILCHKSQVIDSLSMPLGCNRLTQMFYSNLHSKKDIEKASNLLLKHTEQLLKSNKQLKKWPKVDYIVGSSGSIRSLSKIFEKQKQNIQPMNVKKLKLVCNFMSKSSKTEISKIPGLSHRRVDLIQSATLVLYQVCQFFKTEHLFTTQYTLRDGMVENEIEKFISK